MGNINTDIFLGLQDRFSKVLAKLSKSLENTNISYLSKSMQKLDFSIVKQSIKNLTNIDINGNLALAEKMHNQVNSVKQNFEEKIINSKVKLDITGGVQLSKAVIDIANPFSLIQSSLNKSSVVLNDFMQKAQKTKSVLNTSFDNVGTSNLGKKLNIINTPSVAMQSVVAKLSDNKGVNNITNIASKLSNPSVAMQSVVAKLSDNKGVNNITNIASRLSNPYVAMQSVVTKLSDNKGVNNITNIASRLSNPSVAINSIITKMGGDKVIGIKDQILGGDGLINNSIGNVTAKSSEYIKNPLTPSVNSSTLDRGINNNQTYNINIMGGSDAIDIAKATAREIAKIEQLSMVGG